MTRPSILSSLGGDTARTRRTDPITSHIAGDASQATIHQTKLRVLLLVKSARKISGSDLNDRYRFVGRSEGWAPVHYESPRKRAGELAADGYLEVVGFHPSSGNHLPESIYRLTPWGRKVLSLGRVS